MRLTAIRMSNTRSIGPKGLALDDIPKGLSVLAAPNEFGKSTIYDALRIFLLESFKNNNAQTQSLKPWNNQGSPRIEIDVETHEGHFRVTKQFFSGKMALLLNLTTGSVIAKDREVDDWLYNLTGAEKKNYGPIGLLWVAQGASMFQPEGGQAALSGLLEKEVGTLIGGDRARNYLQRATDAYEKERTKSGGAKANGRLIAAQSAVTSNQTLLADLEAKRDEATETMNKLAEARRQLAMCIDEAKLAGLDRDIQEAGKQLEQAERGALEIDSKTSKLRLLEQHEGEASRIHSAFVASIESARARIKEVDDVKRSIANNEKEIAELQAPILAATSSVNKAETAYRSAQALSKLSEAHATAKLALERAAATKMLCDQVSHIDKQIRELSSLFASNPAKTEIKNKLEALFVEQSQARARLDGARPTLSPSLTELGNENVRLNGQPIDNADIRLAGNSELHLAQFGTINIVATDANKLIEAEQRASGAFDEGLASVGCASIFEVRALAETRQSLETELKGIVGERDRLSKKSLAELEHTYQLQLELVPKDFDPSASPPPASENVRLLEQNRDEARATLEILEDKVSALSSRKASLLVGLDIQKEILDEALNTLGDIETWPTRLEELLERKRNAREVVTAAKNDIKLFSETIPDLVATRASLKRLQTSQTELAKRSEALRGDIREYNIILLVSESDGLDEQLQDALSKTDVLTARLDALEFDLDALKLLKDTLSEAQSELQTAYFGPVIAEMQPFLQQVIGPGEIALSEGYQAHTIRRGLISEDVNALSGGTKEQIAVITRLAFARLMAKKGQVMPIVLDDALVNCDDNRLEKMFDVLTRAAVDLQCIVFTCHESSAMRMGAPFLTRRDWVQSG